MLYKQISELRSPEHPMQGYKATNSAGMPEYGRRVRPYEVGRTYRSRARLSVCNGGLHFCRRMADVYSMYAASYKTRVFKVEAIGDTRTLDTKSCTDRLRIVKELAPAEILRGLMRACPETTDRFALWVRSIIWQLLWSVTEHNYRRLAGDRFLKDRIQAWVQAFLALRQELADKGMRWLLPTEFRLERLAGKSSGE